MPDTNITRAEARERSANVRVTRYEVEIDLTRASAEDSATFPSTTTARFTATPGSSTWIDLVAPGVRRAVLNGTDLDVTTFTGTRLPLPGLAADNVLVVEADCAYMRTGEGLHRFVDPVDKCVYLYSQFEVADARRVYACFDQPDLKAEFALTVTAPDDWQVVSNAATPQPEPDDAAMAVWRFDPTPRLSTYVTALVAGPYHVVRDEYAGPHGTYPLGVFCRQSLAEHLDADEVLTVTKQGFEFFESAFGTAYPFGKYDQLFVPEFNAGAMENAACVTILEDYVFRSRVTDYSYEQRANTVLHELAHMWFGDLVTMTWWDDLWLNESFAEWASHHANVSATRYRDAWTTFLIVRKGWTYRQAQLSSTHPIAADMVDLEAVEVNFDGITYAQGAAAIRQLVAWVGEKEFLDGLNAYFATHAWGNTQLSDLLGELERSSGRDLSTWSGSWLETAGVTTLRAEVELGADGTYSGVTIVQEPPSSPEGIAPILRPHRIAIGLYDVVDGSLRRGRRIEVDVVGARTEVPELVGVAQPDLLLLNDDDLTFAKIRLDERSRRTAVESMATLQDSLARALIWAACWDMVRDAEMPLGDFLSLVESGLPTESDINVVTTLLAQVRTAIEVYSGVGRREGYRDRWAAAALGLLAGADPGSDLQLSFARAYAAAARTPEHAAVVRGWLSGDAPVGLSVDTDLRWTLLQRLVALGAADPEEIETELVRDDTATGRRQAATARAAVPTREAKEEAFAAAVDSDELPNAMLLATVAGFSQSDHRELLRGFVDRYFDAVPRVWETRTNETAQTIVLGLYPAFLVEPATLELTDRFLARDDVPPGARRLVREGRDGVERALRCQALDS
ncbi:MAG: aminopeptidase N [Frankiales bacterium]|nr:aminopeptidase N [Frankiales bacterium]